MKKIKILFLHTGAELYGADQILLTIVSNLDKNLFLPIVLLPNDGPLVEKLNEFNIRNEIMSYPIIRRKYFNLKGIFHYVKEFFSSCKSLLKFVESEEIDIIHNNTVAVLEGIYLKRKANVKLITHVHEMIEHPKIIAKFLYKIHLQYCNQMIVVSKAVQSYIETILKRKSNKIVVVHNGIPSVSFDKSLKEKYYQTFGIPHNAKVVAIVGRINAIKGQSHFIMALEKIIRKYPNIYGIIIGDAFPGQEWRINELVQMLHEKKLEENIKISGFRKDMLQVYQVIDLLVLSSIQYDSFPTVILEAMSCGIPAVAYRCGGVEEMITEQKNGILVPQGNIEELSKSIEWYFTHLKEYEKAQKSALQVFHHFFTINHFIQKISNIYIELEEQHEE